MPRIWRTVDGDHVPDGHPDAAFLAYGPGDVVPDHIARSVGVKTPAENKAAQPSKGGVSVDTRDSVLRALEDLGHKPDRRKSTETLRAELEEAQAEGAEGGEEE